MYTKAGIPLRGPRAGSRDVHLTLVAGPDQVFPNHNALILTLLP